MANKPPFFKILLQSCTDPGIMFNDLANRGNPETNTII